MFNPEICYSEEEWVRFWEEWDHRVSLGDSSVLELLEPLYRSYLPRRLFQSQRAGLSSKEQKLHFINRKGQASLITKAPMRLDALNRSSWIHQYLPAS